MNSNFVIILTATLIFGRVLCQILEKSRDLKRENQGENCDDIIK